MQQSRLPTNSWIVTSFLRSSLPRILFFVGDIFHFLKFLQTFGEAEEAALYMRTMMDEANLVIQVINEAHFWCCFLFLNSQ